MFKDSVKLRAQSIGIPSLSESICTALAPDVEFRIREVAQEAIKFMRHSKRDILTTEDVDHALHVKNVEPLFGFSFTSPLNFQQVAPDLYVVENQELDLQKIVESPLPPVPAQMSWSCHYLAVEGVQPLIPQNPASENSECRQASRLQTSLAEKTKRKRMRVSDPQDMEVRPLVKHMLSQEMQLYYTKVTKAILSDNIAQRRLVLQSLACDPGLHQLLPYFVRFIASEVPNQIPHLSRLMALMCMTRSLVVSPYLALEPYLHQLMPPILTCCLAPTLCETVGEDHWALRLLAASIISLCCTSFSIAYPQFQPRITKTMLLVLMDTQRALTTHYGAIAAIVALGPHAIKELLFPFIPKYATYLEPLLATPDANQRRDALRVFLLAMSAVHQVFQHPQYRPFPPHTRLTIHWPALVQARHGKPPPHDTPDTPSTPAAESARTSEDTAEVKEDHHGSEGGGVWGGMEIDTETEEKRVESKDSVELPAPPQEPATPPLIPASTTPPLPPLPQSRQRMWGELEDTNSPPLPFAELCEILGETALPFLDLGTGNPMTECFL
eukprot:gnl/Trimastix_PCT/2590.p1 GENE.gnl/Trimastix_PCT/2590~~gnl/Trimastix_PCT/2590.p1  ORF type:complete len:555 (+),score=75.66 gnl/Trimastix_PCT/2590:74-1738(+)